MKPSDPRTTRTILWVLFVLLIVLGASHPQGLTFPLLIGAFLVFYIVIGNFVYDPLVAIFPKG
ncbi:MAG TPA: hypothetical protein VFS75_02995 [Candidatus Paceibacterota bacterium]|nr:hypothetical protein [Candidatus Paceibacterota bacterium]